MLTVILWLGVCVVSIVVTLATLACCRVGSRYDEMMEAELKDRIAKEEREHGDHHRISDG